MDTVSSLIVDSVLAVLMLAVIGVCFFVYKRLGTIKSGQAELRVLVEQLNKAVVDAQRSVADLKHTAAAAEEKLQNETRKARSMADELSMITQAGNSLADRIEKGLTEDKVAPQRGAAPQKAQAPAEKKQQKEILAALKEAR